MFCGYHAAGLCGSCTAIDRPYAEQLSAKHIHAQQLLDDADLEWLEPVASPESGYRNKAKMVVTGTAAAPRLGILGAPDPALASGGVDLRGCGVNAPELRAAMPVLADFITRAALTPYDVHARRGELKHLLVTVGSGGALMIRFVLRSTESLVRIEKHLGWLRGELPQAAVVSVNLQPEHKAVLEGEREIVLTQQQSLPVVMGEVELQVLPKSFLQTNTDVASALYRQGAAWIEEAAPAKVWDLYCGVGGFALHAAAHVSDPGREVTGIEISAEAVAAAERARDAAGLRATFHVGDATAFAAQAEALPDLMIVNPPRRGLGRELAGWLEDSGVRQVLYSSCNATSLARDLAAMPSLRPTRAQVLDMFPQTSHYEVLTLLRRH
ncbi:23S rRNA (uracil(747)-C(5))-methyltransferase RlmC [Bogoriella caseilytica]|uniref:23S rRNA m(5)U-747 methyltransferase n=1 Tax=Bogoriella caseilytica TaxID=56055 RepID=A0A3N2BGV7_9MICO|nr:23S rRNA (uracil(747)-C(5))-methyltransferase RlmC [Bogoriella caseilytica]ROR74450.1 23S rRNA m(5)U-747 methyltransferase [Bogoriella caseilytica]